MTRGMTPKNQPPKRELVQPKYVTVYLKLLFTI